MHQSVIWRWYCSMWCHFWDTHVLNNSLLRKLWLLTVSNDRRQKDIIPFYRTHLIVEKPPGTLAVPGGGFMRCIHLVQQSQQFHTIDMFRSRQKKPNWGTEWCMPPGGISFFTGAGEKETLLLFLRDVLRIVDTFYSLIPYPHLRLLFFQGSNSDQLDLQLAGAGK